MKAPACVVSAHVDRALLGALQKYEVVTSTERLRQTAWPDNSSHPYELVLLWLLALAGAGYVERHGGSHLDREIMWSITAKGRTHWAALEAQSIADERSRHVPMPPSSAELEDFFTSGTDARTAAEPVQVSVCNAPETPRPAVAILHIGEDELDGWWAMLDIDEKAEAFAFVTLGRSAAERHADAIGKELIPLLGVLDCTGTVPKAVSEFVKSKAAQS